MRNRLGLGIMLLLVVMPLLAEDHPKNAISFSFADTSSTIAYRRSFGPFAAIVNAGYEKVAFSEVDNNGNRFTSDMRAWTIGAGLRRYLATKDRVQPFLEADLSRSIPGEPGVAVVGVANGCDRPRDTAASLSGGVEYHVTRSISVEGAAGISASRGVSRCSSDTFSEYSASRFIGTFRSAVALNIYF